MHIAARDNRGGAAISARRLHFSLIKGGVESSMRVRTKSTDDPSISSVETSVSLAARFRRRLLRAKIDYELHPYRHKIHSGMALFTSDLAPAGGSFWNNLPQNSIIHLHWVSGVVDMGRNALQKIRMRPLVWTLHDCSPFTGGCHHPMNCNSFIENCGACPRLESSINTDLSRAIHSRRSAGYSVLDPQTIRIVAPSDWLARMASTSSLLSRFDIVKIAHGVDTDVFKPRDKTIAREIFGIPSQAKVVLFAAADIAAPSKGIRTLEAALAGIGDPTVVLVSIGATKVDLKIPMPYLALGEINEEKIMSLAYSAADVFVTPTLAESFGLVVLEAMACGIPTIATRVGAVPELVRHGVNGLLIDPGNIEALSSALNLILRSDELRRRFSHAARTIAISEFNQAGQTDKYVRLYDTLLKAAAR